MIELPVYDRSGKEVEKINFDETCLGKFINYDLLHQAVVMFEANQRTGTRSTKTRSMVVGRRGKPFRQKGTGRARQGLQARVGSRSGAVAHGPQPREYRKDMPKKARRAALRSALLGKLRDGEIVIVSDLSLEAPKTKEVVSAFQNLNVNLDKNCLLVTKAEDTVLYKSIRNVEKAEMATLNALNAYSVLKPAKVVITKEALQAIPEELK